MTAINNNVARGVRFLVDDQNRVRSSRTERLIAM